MEVVFERIHPEARVPEKATDGSAGLDLFAPEDGSVKARSVETIKLGFKMSMPKNLAALSMGRSGLGVKSGIVGFLAPGLIDSDYRGEVCLVLKNDSDKDFFYQKGHKIGQLFITFSPDFEICEGTLDETNRDGGFGSTGD